MLKFREHRNSLEESMKTVREFKNLRELLKYLQKITLEYGWPIKAIWIRPYRIRWNTYLVRADGVSVGFLTYVNMKDLEKNKA